jgi:hypothetical protein
VSITLILVAALLATVVLLLAVPIDIQVELQHVEEFSGQIAIRWLFGLLQFRFRFPGAGKASKKVAPEAGRKPGPRKRRTPGSNVLAVLRQASFRRRVVRFLRDLFRAAHTHDLSLRVRLGLGDPADTGMLWTLLGPVSAMAQNLRSAEISLEPEFVDPVLEFESRGHFRLFPIQFIAITIAFVLSRPTIRAWRTLRRQHA